MKYTHNPGKRCQFFKHLRVGKISHENMQGPGLDTDLPYNMAAQFCGDPELFSRKLRMFLFWGPDLRYVLVLRLTRASIMH